MKHGTIWPSVTVATGKQKDLVGEGTLRHSLLGNPSSKSTPTGLSSTNKMKNAASNSTYCSTQEACQRLGISRTTLYKAIRDLKLIPKKETFTIQVKRLRWSLELLERISENGFTKKR